MTSPNSPERRRLSWRLRIWLGTLSTVVALSTGMFALRDQIFPQQAGSARADVPRYERAIGYVCSALNDAQRAGAADVRRLDWRMAHPSATGVQRIALLDYTKAL